jgi:SAM-dependent methyltransferase
MDNNLKHIFNESKLDQLYKNNLFTIKSISKLLNTWDNYTKEEQFKLENLTEEDSNVNKHYRYDGEYEIALTYGELLKKSVEVLIEKINKFKKIDNKDVFVDIGCGAGKLLMHLSIKSDFKTLIGVEIQKERLEYAKYIKKSLFDENNSIFLFNKNIFDFDLSIGTIFFANDVYFTEYMSKNIYDILPNGSHFITSKDIPECKILKDEIYLHNSWSKHPVKYNYYIKYV